jgi:hypothetical protein
MFLTNEGAVLALVLLGLVLGILFISSVVEWLRLSGNRRAGNVLGKKQNAAGQDDRIMSVTVNFPWMNGTWTAEPVLEKSSRN